MNATTPPATMTQAATTIIITVTMFESLPSSVSVSVVPAGALSLEEVAAELSALLEETPEEASEDVASEDSTVEDVSVEDVSVEEGAVDEGGAGESNSAGRFHLCNRK